MAILLAILTIDLALTQSCLAQTDPTHFQKNSSLNDKITYGGHVVTRFNTSSLTACAALCAEQVDCNSLFFAPSGTQFTCQLHGEMVHQHNTLQLATLTGSVYLFKLADLPAPHTTVSSGSTYYTDSSRTTVKSEYLQCPEAGKGWRGVVLPDGTFTKYRLYSDTAYSYRDARDLCEKVSGQLPKILTAEKMAFFINNLTKCPDTAGLSFWIDGTNLEATNKYASDAYKTSMDQTIPLDIPGLWAAGQPGDPGNLGCIWSSPDNSYYLADASCNRTDVMCLCEKLY